MLRHRQDLRQGWGRRARDGGLSPRGVCGAGRTVRRQRRQRRRRRRGRRRLGRSPRGERRRRLGRRVRRRRDPRLHRRPRAGRAPAARGARHRPGADMPPNDRHAQPLGPRGRQRRRRRSRGPAPLRVSHGRAAPAAGPGALRVHPRLVHAEHDGDVLAAEPAVGARRGDRAVPDGQRGGLLHAAHVSARRARRRVTRGDRHGRRLIRAGDVVHEQGDGAVHAVAAAEQRGKETGGGVSVLHAVLPLRAPLRVLMIRRRDVKSRVVSRLRGAVVNVYVVPSRSVSFRLVIPVSSIPSRRSQPSRVSTPSPLLAKPPRDGADVVRGARLVPPATRRYYPDNLGLEGWFHASHATEQVLQVPERQLLADGGDALARLAERGGDDGLLSLLKVPDPVLHRVADEQPHHLHLARLAYSVAPVDGLVLDRRVPPRVGQYDPRGAVQVQPEARGFQRHQEDVRFAAPKFGHHLRALREPLGAVQAQDGVPGVLDLGTNDVQKFGELREDHALLGRGPRTGLGSDRRELVENRSSFGAIRDVERLLLLFLLVLVRLGNSRSDAAVRIDRREELARGGVHGPSTAPAPAPELGEVVNRPLNLLPRLVHARVALDVDVQGFQGVDQRLQTQHSVLRVDLVPAQRARALVAVADHLRVERDDEAVAAKRAVAARTRRAFVALDRVHADRAVRLVLDVLLQRADPIGAQRPEELIAGQRANPVSVGLVLLPGLLQQQRVVASLSQLQEQDEDVHVVRLPPPLHVRVEHRHRPLLQRPVKVLLRLVKVDLANRDGPRR
mmetsp:Transcript_7169/g.32770  ORF Transcript_7169/g.32770 Transcript_7169/m.32770 type:complete len:786 (-) Transcript_7169:671-3028(-)